MKNVYKLTDLGWVLVFKARSLQHAWRVCQKLARADVGTEYCINS